MSLISTSRSVSLFFKRLHLYTRRGALLPRCPGLSRAISFKDQADNGYNTSRTKTRNEALSLSFQEIVKITFSRLFLSYSPAIFTRARQSNEELVRGADGARDDEKEGAEEKEKIVAKEEAESLMIFLITAARGRRDRKRKTGRERERETDTDRQGGVEGDGGRGGGGERRGEREGGGDGSGGGGGGTKQERDRSTLPCQPRIHPNQLTLPSRIQPRLLIVVVVVVVVVVVASRIKSIDLSFFLAREAHEPRGLNLP